MSRIKIDGATHGGFVEAERDKHGVFWVSAAGNEYVEVDISLEDARRLCDWLTAEVWRDD